MLIIVENAAVPGDRRVWHEALSLRDGGWAVTVLAPRLANRGERRDEELDGVRICRFDLVPAEGGPAGYLREYATAGYRVAAGVTRLARQTPFEVIQACNPPDFLLAAALHERWRGSALVFDHHDLAPELFAARFGEHHAPLLAVTRLAERLAYRLADVVLATNESVRAVALERGGKASEDVFVVRNGPLLKRFVPIEPDPALASGAKHLLAWAGLMGRQDGLEEAVRALGHLRARRQDWRAVFFGDGEMRPAAVALVEQLQLSDCVDFKGMVGDVELRRGICSADVCLAPDPRNSLTEASTLVKIGEYMAMGRPVVSFDLRESRVTAREAAVYARADDTRDFARLVDELLSDAPQRAAMGEAGRRRVQTTLAWEHSEAALAAAYERAIERARGRKRGCAASAADGGRASIDNDSAGSGLPGLH